MRVFLSYSTSSCELLPWSALAASSHVAALTNEMSGGVLRTEFCPPAEDMDAEEMDADLLGP